MLNLSIWTVRCNRYAGRAGRHLPPTDPPRGARTAEGIPRVRRRRREDVPDAPGRAPPQGRGDRRRRRAGGDPRPGGNREADRGARRRPAPPPGVPGRGPRGDGPRRRPRPETPGRPHRRAGAHQRPRKPEPQTVPGCPGHPGRGDPRHHHAEHPAPGKPLRHRGEGDPRQDPGADSGHGARRGGPARERRPDDRGPPQAPAGGEDLPAGTDPDRAGEFLQGDEPGEAPGADPPGARLRRSTSAGGRPRRRRPSRPRTRSWCA